MTVREPREPRDEEVATSCESSDDERACPRVFFPHHPRVGLRVSEEISCSHFTNDR